MKWFAWFPVHLDDGSWAWGCYVWRYHASKFVYSAFDQNGVAEIYVWRYEKL